MGAPEVITAPSKFYVAINSYKSTRSLPPTLCDLGRVSNIAAVVIMSRSSNVVTRNNFPQRISSLPIKKMSISEVTDSSHSNSYHENLPSASSTTDVTDSHKKRRFSAGNQSSTSSLVTPSTIKTDLDKSHDYNPKSTSMSNKSPPQIICLKPIQICSPETGAHLHQQINHPARLYSPNTNELPNQQSVEQPTPGMEQLPTYQSHTIQLQQQNQQLRDENVQLQKQLSLFRQLMKNPQRLNQVIARLEQRAQ